ncbi:helix-turn-helix domain-containing protein [Nocardioides bruguierae]|uniref:helix-turn-helix domain-containing protein n=1 Tax=Nocardioides bruguierae TaxID=2945102 RepID=UPI002022467E|nr:helix-turn-helix transcriptional regulator [Nocardioides bruguierae]MCL8026043.1 helix-turn-helix domain-containing protein [Nocardioides bruguierae]
MGNERLRLAIAEHDLTTATLAEQLEVDRKTVERWVSSSRVPYPRFRTQVSKILGLEEAYLWPDRDLSESQLNQASRREIVEVYPNRGAVPHGLWRRLIDEASEQVDMLVFAGLFLVDSHPDLPEQLALRARDGLRARLAYGDPASPVVEQRGIDEGIGMDLGARIRISLAAMAPAVGVEGINVRLHETVLYNSIYRFDDEMLVNTHLVGSPAPRNPVIHLRQVERGQLFSHYLESFEHVWESAEPLVGSPAA